MTIGDLKTRGKTLDDSVAMLKDLMELSEAPVIKSGYCISDTGTFEDVSNYIAQKLGIPEENVSEFDMGQGRGSPYKQVEDLMRVKNDSNQMYLVKVCGFNDSTLSPHGYDQNFSEIERKICGEGVEDPKKILAITSIDPSQVSDDLIRHAFVSDFKSFIYEFE